MEAEEWPYWEALYQLDPWGEERDDLRMAIATASNLNIWAKRKVDPLKLMPNFGCRKERRKTHEELKQAGMALALMFGGTVSGIDAKR